MQPRPSVSVAKSRVRGVLYFVKKHDKSCVDIGLVGYFGPLLHHNLHQQPREYGRQSRNAAPVSCDLDESEIAKSLVKGGHVGLSSFAKDLERVQAATWLVKTGIGICGPSPRAPRLHSHRGHFPQLPHFALPRHMRLHTAVLFDRLRHHLRRHRSRVAPDGRLTARHPDEQNVVVHARVRLRCEAGAAVAGVELVRRNLLPTRIVRRRSAP
jgi:hypothetical protein